ncbi:hypothetical protein IAE19_01125 [Acinetobacter sp. S40]|uniref:hypothetical protein n=1 Tax=Acinetobacter sp. S40 TaxID=2767434 RepID=UPI00190D62BE|nr:hypothetical protein [Acinetobacter sp. S40]MBJ9984045.1 hypothetical protein [Acinetobacter sp. S40]
MKIKLLCCAMLSLAASNIVQAEVNTKTFTTSELKALSCTDLSVEKTNAKRELINAEKNLTNIQTETPNKTISKWAGVASGALSAFGGKSENAAKAKEMANNLVGSEDTSDENNLKLQQALKNKAQTNIENIETYQKSKKCKL